MKQFKKYVIIFSMRITYQQRDLGTLSKYSRCLQKKLGFSSMGILTCQGLSDQLAGWTHQELISRSAWQRIDQKIRGFKDSNIMISVVGSELLQKSAVSNPWKWSYKPKSLVLEQQFLRTHREYCGYSCITNEVYYIKRSFLVCYVKR